MEFWIPTGHQRSPPNHLLLRGGATIFLACNEHIIFLTLDTLTTRHICLCILFVPQNHWTFEYLVLWEGVYRKEGNCLSIAIFVVFPNVNQLFPRRHCQHYVAISLWPNSVMEGNRFPWENHWLSVNTLRK